MWTSPLLPLCVDFSSYLTAILSVDISFFTILLSLVLTSPLLPSFDPWCRHPCLTFLRSLVSTSLSYLPSIPGIFIPLLPSFDPWCQHPLSYFLSIPGVVIPVLPSFDPRCQHPLSYLLSIPGVVIPVLPSFDPWCCHPLSYLSFDPWCLHPSLTFLRSLVSSSPLLPSFDPWCRHRRPCRHY